MELGGVAMVCFKLNTTDYYRVTIIITTEILIEKPN